MPLPSVLPTSLPARPGHKSHRFPGWDDPGALEWRPLSQNLPQSKVAAASWGWDHYCRERRVFGVFSKNIHAGIPGWVIYFHPITSKSLDPSLPILRPLSFHTGLWWRSLAWLITQNALHKNSIFIPLFTAAYKMCYLVHIWATRGSQTAEVELLPLTSCRCWSSTNFRNAITKG